jgi:hypothetical protein
VIWGATIFFKEDWHLTQEFWAYVIFAATSTFIYFIINIIAAFKARQGKMYYMLLFGKMAYETAYRVRPEESAPEEPVNKPPF